MVAEISSAAELAQTLADAGGLVVVDFYGDYCGPCHALAPHITRLAAAYPTVTFCKMNIQRDADLVDELGIACVPTLLFFWCGEEQERFSGADVPRLEASVQAMLHGPRRIPLIPAQRSADPKNATKN